MTAPAITAEPVRDNQLRAARAAIVREIGTQTLAELHKPNALLDTLTVVVLPALFILLCHGLATLPVFGWAWWACVVVQGNLILVLGIVNHEVFVHRKLLAPPWRWIASSILVWPTQLRGQTYETQHLTHHRELGNEGDSERYKMSIDTGLKRLIYATPAVMAYRIWFLKGQTSAVGGLGAPGPSGERTARRVAIERWTRLALFGVALAVAWWDWRYVVYGYLVPFAVATPFFNTMRIVLEHFDLDRGNPLWVGTFYRTGWLTRPMFWWGAGDCHVVHHFYANIPWYRMGRAVALMRPILLRSGVYEQPSLPHLLAEWFGGRRHWSVPLRKP